MASAPVRILVRASGASIDVPAGVVVTAGRGSQCEIHLDDQSGCRRHCSLETVATLVAEVIEKGMSIFAHAASADERLSARSCS